MKAMTQPGTYLAAGALIAACGVIGWGLGRAVVSDVRADLSADPRPAAPITVTAPIEPYSITVADCARTRAVHPCAEIQGLSWVLVWPDGSTRIEACAAEDGGPTLPCVRTTPAPGGYLVFANHLEVR